MQRKDFIKKCTSCGALALMGLGLPYMQPDPSTIGTGITTNFPEANDRQILHLLSFIDAKTDEPVKNAIFGRLGFECFHCTNAEKWIRSMDLNDLLEFVNNGKSSRWEKLEYCSDTSRIDIIGRKVPCDCQYAQFKDPPKSLCTYCCKGFLKEFFGNLLKKNVDVTIGETVLRGGERCCAIITIG